MLRGRSFRMVDYVVIAVLYIGNVVDIWTVGWVTVTDNVLFGSGGDDSASLHDITVNQSFRVFALFNGMMVIYVKCVLCLVLAFWADLQNRKYFWYFVSLLLWILAPLAGLATSLAGSPALAFSLPWLAAVLFVTSPLKYCLIFNQRLSPSRDQTRMVVATFEFVVCACSFLVSACFPNSLNINVSTLAAMWGAAIAPVGVFVILLTAATRHYCTLEKPTERSFNKLFLGIYADVAFKKDDTIEVARLKKLAILRLFMFILLLCPVIAVTIILQAHGKATRALSKEVKFEGSWFQFSRALTNLLAIPVISLIVSLSKGTRGSVCDYMVLTLAHVLNTTIMLLLYLYFRRYDFSNVVFIPQSNHSDSIWLAPIIKEIPGKGVATVNVYFHGVATEDRFFFQSSLDEHIKKVSFVKELIPVKNGRLTYNFSVWNEGGPRLNQSIIVRERKRYLFLATGRTLNVNELIYLPGVKDFIPERDECLIIVSSIAEGPGRDSANLGVFKVLQHETVIRSSQMPEASASLDWCVPAGNTTFTLEIAGPEQLFTTRLQTTLEPFRQSLIMVSWDPGPTTYGTISLVMYTIAWYEESNVANTTRTLLDASNGLEGVVAAAATVGYVQFFWMEAPVRLRTTLFACFVVVNEVARRLVDVVIDEVREEVSFTLLILSATAGFVHVFLGALYDFKLRKGG